MNKGKLLLNIQGASVYDGTIEMDGDSWSLLNFDLAIKKDTEYKYFDFTDPSIPYVSKDLNDWRRAIEVKLNNEWIDAEMVAYSLKEKLSLLLKEEEE